MKKTILGLSIVASLLTVSCGSKSLKDVKTGMSEQEVKDLLGEPNGTQSSSNSSSVNGAETSSASTADWDYNGTGHVYFENGKVVRTEPAK